VDVGNIEVTAGNVNVGNVIINGSANNITVSPNVVLGPGGLGVVGGSVSLSSSTTFSLGETTSIPPVSGTSGNKGEIRWGTDTGVSYLYICVSLNTWRRVALSAF